MNDGFERIWKEEFVADFKALSQHFPIGFEENHERVSISRLRDENRNQDLHNNKQMW
jgi:hypothetical protein